MTRNTYFDLKSTKSYTKKNDKLSTPLCQNLNYMYLLCTWTNFIPRSISNKIQGLNLVKKFENIMMKHEGNQNSNDKVKKRNNKLKQKLSEELQ